MAILAHSDEEICKKKYLASEIHAGLLAKNGAVLSTLCVVERHILSQKPCKYWCKPLFVASYPRSLERVNVRGYVCLCLQASSKGDGLCQFILYRTLWSSSMYILCVQYGKGKKKCCLISDMRYMVYLIYIYVRMAAIVSFEIFLLLSFSLVFRDDIFILFLSFGWLWTGKDKIKIKIKNQKKLREN